MTTRFLTARRLVAATAAAGTNNRLVVQSRSAINSSSWCFPIAGPSSSSTRTRLAAAAAATATKNGLLVRSFSSSTDTSDIDGNHADSSSSIKIQNDLVQQYATQGDVLQAGQVLLLMQKRQTEDGNDQVYPNAQAYSTVLHAWLKLENQEQDGESAASYYNAVDRATEVLFQWREAAAKSGSRLSAPSITLDYHAILEAWTEIAHIKGVPQRAQHILELLEKDDGELSATLVVESYNHVMQCWANSTEHLRGSMAQSLFAKLQEYEQIQAHKVRRGSNQIVQPNGTSYRTMIHAWVHSGESKAAFRATGHLMKLLRLLEYSESHDNSNDLEPTMDEYHKICEAWTTAKDKHAAEKSLSVLRLMEYAYMHRFSDLRADITMYRSILHAYAQSDASPELGPDVDKLFEKIWDVNLVPDTDCFAFAIQTYANCALHKDLVLLSGNDAAWQLAQRAHELLEDMMRAVHKSDTVQVPSTETYNAVLKAYTAVVTRDASESALELIARMEQNDEITSRPNAATYALVVTTLSKSPSVQNKVEQSQDLIRRAQSESTTNEAAKPDVFLYNALIRTCVAAGFSSSSILSELKREETFRLALTTLQQDMKGMGVTPDSETFLFLLEASASLLSTPSAMQSRAIEQIFQSACQAGLVDQLLLTRFRDVAPPALYTSLVLEAAEQEDDGTRVVPMSWSVNVTTKGLISNRKKAPALTVDGKLFLTSAMKDRRMRRLRQRRNKQLLQGGRLHVFENSPTSLSLEEENTDDNVSCNEMEQPKL